MSLKPNGLRTILLLFLGLEIFVLQTFLEDSIKDIDAWTKVYYWLMQNRLSLLALLLSSIAISISWKDIRISLNERFQKRANKKELSILEDNPKYDPSSDLLHRKVSKDSIVQLLGQDWNSTFTIHLDGAWGSGKTTLINFVKSDLKTNNDFLFFDFNPSTLSKDALLIGVFFNELQRRYPKFKNEANQLKIALVEASNHKLGMNLLKAKPTSIEEMKLGLTQTLGIMGKKLVICIDDIDRLTSKDEIVEAFKIVREFQFPKARNIIFILSFDSKVVGEFLTSEKSKDAEYLEKICNFTIKILTPKHLVEQKFGTDLSKLTKNLDLREGYLEAIFEAYDWVKGEKDYSSRGKDKTAVWNFNTIRQEIIFLNSFIPALKLKHLEVNAKDFLILNIIKVFFRNIYDDIVKNSGMYLEGNYISLSPHSNTEKESKLKEIIKEHVENITNSTNRKVVIRLLSQLFPVVNLTFGHAFINRKRYEEGATSQNIAHTEYFHRYFFEEIFNVSITDGQFFEMIKNWRDISREEKRVTFKPMGGWYGQNNPVLNLIPRHIKRIPEALIDEFTNDCALVLPQRGVKGTSNHYTLSRIIYDLMDVRFRSREVNKATADQQKLSKYKQIIEGARIDFAVTFCEAYILKDGWNENDFEGFYMKLRKTLGERVVKDVISKEKDVFRMISSEGDVLNLLYNSGIKRSISNKYLDRILEKHPKYFIHLIHDMNQNKGQTRGYVTNQKIIDSLGFKRMKKYANNLIAKTTGERRKTGEKFLYDMVNLKQKSLASDQ